MVPYYFIAIHNEPYHLPGGEERIVHNYEILRQMILKANQRSIKLTLMFSAQWAQYISISAERMKELNQWKQSGHEIAAHHHTIYHENWDGFTNYSEDIITEQRLKLGKQPEPYLGNFINYMEILKKINPDIKSGCMNDEDDKKEIPEEIIYDTCSGFINFGEAGRRISGIKTAEQGVNEFITKGNIHNKEKKFLAHYPLWNTDNLLAAQHLVKSMKSGVYGVISHSFNRQAKYFYSFIETIHEIDPEGVKSRTVSEVIEQKLIPDVKIPDSILTKRYFGETIY